MRNDLKANEFINEVTTDVDNKTVAIKYQSGAKIESIINETAQSNDKLQGWAFIDD